MKKIILLITSLLLISCIVDYEDEDDSYGEISFNLLNIIGKATMAAKNEDPNIPNCSNGLVAKTINLILKDSEGKLKEYSIGMSKISLGDSKKIKLIPGNYSITSFIIIGDDDITPIWVAPKMGSYYQQLFNLTGVNDLFFTVEPFNIKQVHVDVLCYNSISLDNDYDGVPDDIDFNSNNYFERHDLNNNGIEDYYDKQYLDEGKTEKIILETHYSNHDGTGIKMRFKPIPNSSRYSYLYIKRDNADTKWQFSGGVADWKPYLGIEIEQVANEIIKFIPDDITTREQLKLFLDGIYRGRKLEPLKYVSIQK